jgi:hypothetical protein
MYGWFYNAVKITDGTLCSVEWQTDWVMMNEKRFGRQRFRSA